MSTLVGLILIAPSAALHVTAWRAPHAIQRCAPCRATISEGGKVVVVGGGPVMVLAAKLAAMRGFETTCCVSPQDLQTAPSIVYDDATPEGSLPLSFLPIAGEAADPEAVEAAAAAAEGLIIAFDSEQSINEPALNIFMPAGGNGVKHVSMMSRHLNGDGMGFFPRAAKTGANFEIWANDGKSAAGYKAAEALIRSRAPEVGAAWTVVRAGTLKAGGKGDPDGDPPSGEASFLAAPFYKMGQQDIVNWRLLYDVDNLGVKLVAGDTLPGPGFTAAFTAQEKCGAGDSHRGAVATALVEALRVPAAANKDFGVAAEEGRKFPSEEQWKEMFAAA